MTATSFTSIANIYKILRNTRKAHYTIYYTTATKAHYTIYYTSATKAHYTIYYTTATKAHYTIYYTTATKAHYTIYYTTATKAHYTIYYTTAMKPHYTIYYTTATTQISLSICTRWIQCWLPAYIIREYCTFINYRRTRNTQIRLYGYADWMSFAVCMWNIDISSCCA